MRLADRRMPQKRLSMPAWGWEPHRACESLDCNFTSFSDHFEGDVCVDKVARASISSAAKPRALELLPDVPRCGHLGFAWTSGSTSSMQTCADRRQLLTTPTEGYRALSCLLPGPRRLKECYVRDNYACLLLQTASLRFLMPPGHVHELNRWLNCLPAGTWHAQSLWS